MQRSIAFRIGFLSVVSCLALLIGMFASTGTASAYSAAPAHSATSAWGGGNFGAEGYGGGEVNSGADVFGPNGIHDPIGNGFGCYSYPYNCGDQSYHHYHSPSQFVP